MASGGGGDSGGVFEEEEEDKRFPLFTDNRHILLQAEHEEVQQNINTTWRFAQLTKDPVMKCRETGVNAQLKSSSRLEETRVQLQGRLHQAIDLFSSREISPTQAERKQRALEILQPVVLQEFLEAVEHHATFCSEKKLQDVMSMSESVRQQWEVVYREMSDFVPDLWSKIREGTPPRSDEQSKSSEPTDQDVLHHPQVVVGEDNCGEEELEQRQTQIPGRSSDLQEEQLMEVDGVVETQLTDGESELTSHSREHDDRGITTQDTQTGSGLSQKPNWDHENQRLRPDTDSQPLHDRVLPMGCQDTGTTRKDDSTEVKAAESTLNQRSSLEGAEEEQQRSDPGQVTGSSDQVHQHVQVVFRRDMVETGQGTDVSGPPPPPQGQEVLPRMTYTEKLTELMESESDPRVKNDTLENQAKQSGEMEEQNLKPTAVPEVLSSGVVVWDLQQFRQHLRNVKFAAQAVDQFLATVRDVEAKIPVLLSDQGWSQQPNEADEKLATQSQMTELQQELDSSADQTGSVKTEDLAPGTEGEAVRRCQGGRTFMELEENEDEMEPSACPAETADDDTQQVATLEEEPFHPLPPQEESRVDVKIDLHEETPRMLRSNEDTEREGRGRRQAKEKGNFLQRRTALITTLREIQGEAERLKLQEATLPALQRRSRVLTELDLRLSGLLSELQFVQASPPSSICPSSEVLEVWQETTKVLSEELGQCCVLTELMKRFQSLRAELSGTLQRAESTISERASYLGKNNLQRLYSKVQEVKAELKRAGSSIEEVRGVCRKLHVHLRQMTECYTVQFENDADSLMDSWLDISERTNSRLENLHLGMTLWDGLLRLGAEVEKWTDSKLSLFVQSPSFQSEEDIETLQEEFVVQERNVEHFERRISEIQSLTNSTDPPLELQVSVTQMRKKLEELKELVSEAEDVFRQMEAVKKQISTRTSECFHSLKKIQDSLQSLTGSDVLTVRSELQDLFVELKAQDEQAQSVLEDLRLLTCISSCEDLQTLCLAVVELQEEVKNTGLLLSEVEEQTQRNAQSGAVEAQTCTVQQVDALSSQQRELDGSITETQSLLQGNSNQRVEQVETEVSGVQRELRDVAEKVTILSFDHEAGVDLNLLKEQWRTLQDIDLWLMEMSSRVLRDTAESSVSEETCPADVIPSVVTEDFHSLQSLFLQKKQEFVQSLTEVVKQLQLCRETNVEELLPLQQFLKDVLSDTEVLQNIVGAEVTKVLETEVSGQGDEMQTNCQPLCSASPQPQLDKAHVHMEGDNISVESLPENFRQTNENSALEQDLILRTQTSHEEELQQDLPESLHSEPQSNTDGGDESRTSSGKTTTTTTTGASSTSTSHPPPGPTDSSLSLQEDTRSPSTMTGNTSQITSSPRDTSTAATCHSLDVSTTVVPTGSSRPTDSLEPQEEILTPKNLFSIMLEMEPRQKRQQKKDEFELSHRIPEEKLDLLTSSCQKDETELIENRLSDQTGERKKQRFSLRPRKRFTIMVDLESPMYQQKVHGSSWYGDETDSLWTPETAAAESESNKVKSPSATLLGAPQCQLLSTSAGVRPELTGFCHTVKTTVLSAVKSSLQSGDAFTGSHLPAAADSRQVTGAADAAESTAEEGAESAEGGTGSSEGPRSELQEEEDGGGDALQLEDESDVRFTASQEDTEETHRQPQMPVDDGEEGDMDSVRTKPGQSPEEKETNTSSSMMDIWLEIQGLVERSNIINRAPHVDLNWYLKSSPGEPEIRLVRTVQQVLACRYRAAQLDVKSMAKQLEEAEELRSRVEQSVANMKSVSSAQDCDPNTLRRAEGQWSAALLDASATVQVKAAQLDQVKRYHQQMKMVRAFLQVLAAEKDKMSLNALGSSAVQAEQLQALLKTMERKKDMMEKLLNLSSQFSVHLSDSESSGALLAQFGDVQEEWRLLEGSIKRALRHAKNSALQSSGIIEEAEGLRTKLEDLKNLSLQSSENKSALELVCLSTDVKLCKQLYQHQKFQLESLVHFSLGQKEKDEIQSKLQELEAILDVTKTVDALTQNFGGSSSILINKQLQDLIIWAKQAEHHICIGKKLSLFPEEARRQIVDMKKFQTDILSRRSKMQAQVDEIKEAFSDMEKAESDQVVKTVEDLYEAIADSLDLVLDTMRKHLEKREKLLSQLASMEAWLVEFHAARDSGVIVENISTADVQQLQSEVERHRSATEKIQNRLQLVEEMAEGCEAIAAELSPGESRYLVNRISGLWTDLDGLLAHEKAKSWELEELIQERTSSDEELSSILNHLKQISKDLEKQKFPSAQESLSTVAGVMHVLMESQCQVRELQHCREAKRSVFLSSIGELQDRCKALQLSAFEQEKYLHLRRQMEESENIAREQMKKVRNKALSVGERFRLCQTLLVELPLVKTQCQDPGDQLEAIALELRPSELRSERHKIHGTVETLVSWEHSVSEDIKRLESKLLMGQSFSAELSKITELFQTTKAELKEMKMVCPDEKKIDGRLRRYWVLWRNMQSALRVLEVLGWRDLRNFEELHPLMDTTMQECHLQMETLSQARESLKDYQWAAQGAIVFLHNAEATFLSAPGGFLDCTEEQRQTQQALEALEDGFQAHISHLEDLVPQEPCLSKAEVQQLHISIVSQLLVGRAVLEAQAQLRLESLQRCVTGQKSHRSCHQNIRQQLSALEIRLAECTAAQVTSHDKCLAQQKEATLLMEDLRSLALRIEDLRAGCPIQGCGVGKDGELGALWRHWSALRRGVGLLMARTEQRQEEWKDITTSIQQCCNFLASLQSEVPDSVSFTQNKPQELLAQAEIHLAGLEQQALSSLEHRLEHALSLSDSQDPSSPGPVGKTLVEIQENVRSLKEKNLLVVAAARAEENKRSRLQQEMEEVEKNTLHIQNKMETCLNPSLQQELCRDLSSQKTRLRSIMEGLQKQYTDIPADLSQHLQQVELSLQRADEKLMEGNHPVSQLAGRVEELGSGLERVKVLLEQKSPTVSEAQQVLRLVWDELDSWHSQLMQLESEVQDLAEEHPDQAHVLMDHLTQPLQLYQNASQMVENRTSFLSKIPVCLKEFEDIVYSAFCWLDEAQAWLSAPCSFTTAKSLQNHANSLQLVLDDSERIRDMLQNFRPVLDEISAVCDVSVQKDRLNQNDQGVQEMQRHLLEPLEQLLQAAAVVEAMEDELKAIDKNILKIRTILSTVDEANNITPTEHLHNRQVILANMQSIRRTMEEMERCKDELPLPRGAEESLLVFSRAKQLQQPLQELEDLTRHQASQLENKIREKEERVVYSGNIENPKNVQQADSSLSEHLVQETFAVSNTEEEEDDDDKSCHSSSSDTLTCSIPEDPEETDIYVKEKKEDQDKEKCLLKVEEVKIWTPEVEMSSNGTEAQLCSQPPGCDITVLTSRTGFKSADSEAEVNDSTSAAAENRGSFDSEHLEKFLQSVAAVGDTRQVPVRPITPFTASTGESSELLKEEEDEDLTLSTASHHIVDDLSGGKGKSPMSNSNQRLEKSTQVQNSTEVQLSLVEPEPEEDEDLQRRSQVHHQISQTLTFLTKGQKEQLPDRMSDSRTTPVVLKEIQETTFMLGQLVRSEDGSDPNVKQEKLHQVLQRVGICLEDCGNLLSPPGGTGDEDTEDQLRLLQQECVSAELTTLAEVLNQVEPETRSERSNEDPDTPGCLSRLQDCLGVLQLLLTSSIKQLYGRQDLQSHHQFFRKINILNEFEPESTETFPGLKDGPGLERCVLGRHLRESPGEEAKLQRASWASLQGITHLLEVGEECIKERQMSQVQSRGQLQDALCRQQNLLRILWSHLALVQHLFRCESEPLQCQEDERLQLEVRAKALQQQALGQEVDAQRRLQEWTIWEDAWGRLGPKLDEFGTLINGEEPEGDDDEETVVQQRLESCQKTLVQLEESRPAVGQLLDLLNSDLPSNPSLGRPTGGALLLRWKNALRCTKQEIERCRDVQDTRSRFHSAFSSVSNWLLGANKLLKSWSELEPECVHHSLTEMLDFSVAVEVMSTQRTSACREAARLMNLSDTDCPELRSQISQLEEAWDQLTSDFSKTQEQMQKCLVAQWTPKELLPDLSAWLKKQEDTLLQQKDAYLKAENAAEIKEVLQKYKELKAGCLSVQLHLDFFSTSGPQAAGAELQLLKSERTTIAEKLDDVKHQCLHLQGELQSQICAAEQIHDESAVREKKLKHLSVWIEEQKEKVTQWEQPISLTLSGRTLAEWKEVGDKVKEVAEGVEELKASRVHPGQEELSPCDAAFSTEAEKVSGECVKLQQQMEGLKPRLLQTLEAWTGLEKDLRQFGLNTTEMRCVLHHRPTLFSSEQAQGHMELLQQVKGKAENGEEFWSDVENSLCGLVTTLHCQTAQALSDRVKGEQRRWQETWQQLKDECVRSGDTVSLWQEYRRLHESSSSRLERLRSQWEELLTSAVDTQALVPSVENLQKALENMQSDEKKTLEVSKCLMTRLRPVAANLIQSESSSLSRDILLLTQAVSGKKKSLQEDLIKQKHLRTSLENLEQKTQIIREQLDSGLKEKDSVKQVLSQLLLLSPSLLDVLSCLTEDKQDEERVHELHRKWTENYNQAVDMNRKLQSERQLLQTFEDKCEELTGLGEKITEESRKPQSLFSHQELLSFHQRLEAEVHTGDRLLHHILCDAVQATGTETQEKSSQTLSQAINLRQRWFRAVALVERCRSEGKDLLKNRRIYDHGSTVLKRLLDHVNLLLQPNRPVGCAVQQPIRCVDHDQCVEKVLDLHLPVFTQTLEAGKRLGETVMDSEHQSRLESELQALEETWKQSLSQLQGRRDLVRRTVQSWSQCQDSVSRIMTQLDQVKTRLMEQPPGESKDEEVLMKETQVSLQHLSTQLKELGSMKTDLSQYVAAGDSALLEQQLEELHLQWEELCTKVSLRKQEIADRLNAWTIFNDKNKEFCDWLTQMEKKVHRSSDLSIQEMVEKLKKDCMEEINLFSENKRHLKQLGEQLLLASDQAKQTQVNGSLQEIDRRWHQLFHHIEARVTKLKETLVAVQQLDKNMSNLRSWLCRIEAELSRPVTYSVCHHQEIQRRLAEQQELQRDIEQHTEGVTSMLSLCDVLLRDEDAAAAGRETESDSLQETSRSLDQRWRTICAMAVDRRFRIEETWRLWCKFLEDFSRFEDWLKVAERTAANPNSAGVLYTAAKEELKKFEGFQRQVHERLTQLEIVNNQYRRLVRENRTDRASHLKDMVREGNRRWDTLHRRVASILRRLKYFTNQREEFEGTRENLLVWLTDLDLQLTNVEHFSESDVHHKIQQLNSFQKEITLNTERIDALIVFGEGLIQRSSPQDAALIEEELEELHTYCQEVFSRLVRFHQRLSQPPMVKEEEEPPEFPTSILSLDSSLELIGRPWLGRGFGSLPATPTHLLTTPLERSGCGTPVSVDSLPLEWDHTGDVGGSSSHEDEEDEDDEGEGHEDEEGRFFSALSAPSRCSMFLQNSSLWATANDAEVDGEAPPTLTSTPNKQGFLGLTSQCSENIKRVSLILDDHQGEQVQELGLMGLAASDQQTGVIERWELLQVQTRVDQQADPQEPEHLRSDLDRLTSWLEEVTPELDLVQNSGPAASIADMESRARDLKEMQRRFADYKSLMLSINLRAETSPDLQQKLSSMNRDWSRVSSGLQQWDVSLRKTLMNCQDFHRTLHSLLLWLAHAESRRFAVDINDPETSVHALQQHRDTLTSLREELQTRQIQQASLHTLWSQLQPEEGTEDCDEAQEKLHVTRSKLKMLLRNVDEDLSALGPRLKSQTTSDSEDHGSSESAAEASTSTVASSPPRGVRDSSPPRSFFYRVLRAAFPLHLLLLLLLMLPCLIPMSESVPSCSLSNNFARSFYPMLHYTNGPPPT